MLSPDKITEIVEAALERISWDKSPHELYLPIEYAIKIRGKRIRPRLCLTTYNLFKDEIEDSIIFPAIALEVFHNFSLIHDDVMDNATLRRGKPTVFKKWNTNTAILSGDVMSILSYTLMTKAPAEKLPAVLSLFSDTALGVCEGQQLDANFEVATDVSMKEYRDMIGLKTGVLIACSAALGAIIGDATSDECKRLYDFGYLTGVAFQIQDDLLDLFGDERIFGKAIGGDILNNKKTWLIVKAQEVASSAQKEELHRIFQMEASAEKISAAKNFMAHAGINKMAEEEISNYYNRALSLLETTRLTIAQREQLKAFARELIGRQK